MKANRQTVCGLAVAGLGMPLIFGLPATAEEGADVPDAPGGPAVTTVTPTDDIPQHVIDLGDLAAGDPPQAAWIESGVIRTPEGELPLDTDLDVRAFAPTDSSAFIALDDTTGDGGDNRLVRIDEDGSVTEIAAGQVTQPFVMSADGAQVAWSEWSSAEESGRLAIAESGTGEIVAEEPLETETYTVGFAQESVVVDEANGVDGAKIWVPGDGVADLPGASRVMGTDPRLGLASVVTGSVDDPETGFPLACSSVIDTAADGAELWSSCDVTPLSFSPDGQYVWARDTRTDDAVPSSMYVVDAETGDAVVHLDIQGTTQRVAWESDGSVLFDAWTGGEMAIVRCGAAAACELATDPAPHEGPIDERELPYLLSR